MKKFTEKLYRGWLFHLALVIGTGLLFAQAMGAGHLFEAICYVGMGISIFVLYMLRPSKPGLYNVWFENQ